MREAVLLVAFLISGCGDSDRPSKSGGSGGSGASSGSGGKNVSDGSAGWPSDSGTGGSGGSCAPVAPSLARIGDTVEVPTLAETAPKRNPDVAHDEIHDVYLMVTGAVAISGTFLDATGKSLAPPFSVSQDTAYAQTPRVISAGGKMLVTWHDNRNNPNAADLRARILAWNGSSVDTSSPDFQVGAGTYHEMGSALAFSETSQQFLVVWQTLADSALHARLLDTTGTLLASEITVNATPDYHSGAAASWNSARNEFLIAYAHAGSVGATIRVRRMNAADGQLIGDEVQLVVADGTWTARTSYEPCDDSYVVGWYALPGGLKAVRLSADATPIGTPFALAPGYGGYDSLTVTRHPLIGTLLSAFHGLDDENYAIAYLPSGEQTSVTQVTDTAPSNGNFNPRVAASSLRKEWLLVTAREFSSVVAQRIGP